MNNTTQQAIDRLKKAYNNGVILRTEAWERLAELLLEFPDDTREILLQRTFLNEDNGAIAVEEQKRSSVTSDWPNVMSDIIMNLTRTLHGGDVVARPSLTVDEMRLIGRMATVAASFGEIDTKPYILEAIVAMIMAAMEVGQDK